MTVVLAFAEDTDTEWRHELAAIVEQTDMQEGQRAFDVIVGANPLALRTRCSGVDLRKRHEVDFLASDLLPQGARRFVSKRQGSDPQLCGALVAADSAADQTQRMKALAM